MALHVGVITCEASQSVARGRDDVLRGVLSYGGDGSGGRAR